MTDDNRKDRHKKLVVHPDLPISDAISVMDSGGVGILLLCDDDSRFVGLVTDGDIRRAILRKIDFSQPCGDIATRDPVVAEKGISKAEAVHLMDHGKSFVVNQLPVIDDSGRLVELILRRDLITEEQIGLTAVVMAGGLGTRLRPLTEKTPKPLLPVGDKPVMEILIKQLGDAGIKRVNIATHYRGDQIKDHFGDGSKFDLDLSYVDEDSPLGTAGALGLMDKPGEPILVVNGDILTGVNFRAMLNFHREHSAEMTVGVRQYDIKVPYGVLECQGPTVKNLMEKPQYNLLVNAGIYLLEPSVLSYIPQGIHCNMTDLIQKLIDDGRTVASFPIVEYWLDIGQPDDYQKALDDAENGRAKK